MQTHSSNSNQTARSGISPAPCSVAEFSIERSRDYALISRLATDPAIFPLIADDHSPGPETFETAPSDFVIYLVANDRKGAFGFGAFLPRTYDCYEGHFGFLPRSYGAQALAALRAMFGWLWRNTEAARIVGEIPVENRRAIRFCQHAGCEFYGINPRSTLRGGILRDQFCLGISRPLAPQGLVS